MKLTEEQLRWARTTNRELAKMDLPPGTLQYVRIGHAMRGDGSEEIWWTNNRGEIESAPTTGETEFHYQNGSNTAECRGRVDHTFQQISVTGRRIADQDVFYRQRLRNVSRKLAGRYPGYEIFVITSSGLVPLSELLAD
jgi:hypothetical protein